MKEYNEQVVETLDDAGCIIANKNIIIDNFQARIAELEGDVAIERASRKYWEDAYSEWINTDKAAQGLIAKDERIAELEAENARLKEIEQTNDTLLDQLGDKNAALLDEVASQKHCYAEAVAHYEKQLAAAQAYAEQLQVALQTFIDEHEECTDADDWMAMLCSIEAHHVAEEALALPRDTSALDAYVSEKVKEIIESHAPEGRNVTNAQHVEMRHKFVEQIATLTRQRDLAVEALEKQGHSAGCRKNAFGDICTCGLDDLLSTVKESEAMAQGEKKGV